MRRRLLGDLALKHWAGLAVFLLGLGSAVAAPVMYSEAVSGDLSNDTGNSVGTLDVGSNTVQGRFCLGTGTVCPDGDFDDFRFTLPSGLAVESVSFAFITSATTDTTSANTQFNLHDSTNAVLATSGLIDLMTNGTVSMFTSALPLTQADEYRINQFSSGMNGTNAAVDYTWTLQVSGALQVPEPATLALLGIALAGLGFSRRKQVFN